MDIVTYDAKVWRLVEAQHSVSTMKLVDSVDEQALLEAMIDGTKPSLPPECEGLHYLLATPFRYGAVYPHGSRFRRAGRTAGVYYASEQISSAVSELVFYRLLFFAESPATPFPDNATDFSAFSVHVKSARAIDISKTDSQELRHLVDYAACQRLADEARADQVEIIRYLSARDPKHGANVAVLHAGAFVECNPLQMQTWRIMLGRGGASAFCDFPSMRMSFSCDTFMADPRLADFQWER